MAKKAKRKYKRKTDFTQPETPDVDLVDIEDVNDPGPERPGPERPMMMGGRVERPYDEEPADETSDLLVILAVLVHHLGINAVEPTPEQVAKVQAHCMELGHDIDTATLVEAFKRAQIELLRRQLD